MYIYTVQAGDSLYSVAERFNTTPARIAADNALNYPNRLVIGQHLIIMSDIMQYRIEEGQTLYSVSREFEIPLETLLEANPDLNPLALHPGDTVFVPIEENAEKRPAVINGFAYPNITESALSCSLPSLTYISPFSYSISADGTLTAPADGKILQAAPNYNTVPLMTVTNISEGSFSTETLSQILADDAAREKLIAGILSELSGKGYGGVNLDMEYISPEDKDSYNSFLRELSDRLHAAGYILITAVAPKYRADQPGILYESHDYKVQGEAADYVIIMTYEWGYTYSAPMSVQPINEVRKVLTYATSEIPGGKILMGMPNYGYVWDLPYTRGTAARAIGFTAALDTAVRNNSEILWDEKSATPYFYYTENGVRRVVWFDDAKSIDAKLRLIDEFNLAGASYWTVNRCFSPNWIIARELFEIIKL